MSVQYGWNVFYCVGSLSWCLHHMLINKHDCFLLYINNQFNRTGTNLEWVLCMLRIRNNERNLDMLDTSRVFGWVKHQLKQPKKQKYDHDTYPRVLLNDFNTSRSITTACELCHEIHRVRLNFNGISWHQVTNNSVCPYPQKCQNILPNIITPNKNIVSSSYDMDDNTRLNNITYIPLHGEHLIENPITNEKWAETRINNEKNTHRIGLLHTVLNGIREVTTKQTYHVTFNNIVMVKTIPGRHHHYQRHVTFSEYIMVRLIPSNMGI